MVVSVDCWVVVDVTVLVVVVVVIWAFLVEEAFLVLVVMLLVLTTHWPPTTPAAHALHMGAGSIVVMGLHPGRADRGPSRSSG